MNQLGYYFGAFLILLIAIFLSKPEKDGWSYFFPGEPEWKVALRLYRGPLLLVLYLFLAGVNLYGWRVYRIDHITIFELDWNDHITEKDLFEVGAIFGVAWALSLFVFLHSSSIGLSPYASPLLLGYFCVLFFINPTKTWWYRARGWLSIVWARIMVPPVFTTNLKFSDIWFADQLISLATVMLDFEYLFCFCFLISPNYQKAKTDSICREIDNSALLRLTIACFPAWVRLTQCLKRFYSSSGDRFPHLLNAARYSLGLITAIFATLNYHYKRQTNEGLGPYFIPWIIFLIMSSLCGFLWDIKMDWGLFSQNAGENTFLRETLIYPKGFYYFAIVQDMILRFGWALPWSIIKTGYLYEDLLVTVLAMLEVFRRFIWNFLRVEYEHIGLWELWRR